MANPEHERLVRRGARAIGAWRKKHPMARLNLSRANLRGVDLTAADLSNANLNKAGLTSADLTMASLRTANLRGADLQSVNLDSASLVGADLTDAVLFLAQLDGSVLAGTELSGASLAFASLVGASVAGARFAGARFRYTVLANMDLSAASGLEAVLHDGPSTIGVDTLIRSRGSIPVVFLRGCGVPETFISYLPSLLGNALDFYTCFISYCEEDNDFSERLYNDLQGRGVRCWRWREDSKWGNDLVCDIDRAVRVYDKLVLICSKDSLESKPVQDEIIRAIQREQREKKNVLFPITIDDHVFNWDHGYAVNVTKKHVGDFREWKDPKAYKKSVGRLIRDLRQNLVAQSRD
jgi:hypothetical protein